jgi:hypothetical protein
MIAIPSAVVADGPLPFAVRRFYFGGVGSSMAGETSDL